MSLNTRCNLSNTLLLRPQIMQAIKTYSLLNNRGLSMNDLADTMMPARAVPKGSLRSESIPEFVYNAILTS